MLLNNFAETQTTFSDLLASVEETAKNAVWQRDTDLLKSLKEENQFLRQELNDLKSKMDGKSLVAPSDIFSATPAPPITTSEPKSKEPSNQETPPPAPEPSEESGPPPPAPPDMGGAPPPPPPMGNLYNLITLQFWYRSRIRKKTSTKTP